MSVTYYHVSVKYNHVSVTYYHVSVTYLIHLAQLHDTHLGGVSVSRKEYTLCQPVSSQLNRSEMKTTYSAASNDSVSER